MAPTSTKAQGTEALLVMPPPSGRTLWNSDMIACLLDLRLGLLLPQFAGAGGAPGALKDAWKALRVKFALATNVNLSMLQLKNKYQQLKREYQLTTQQLDARRKREAKRVSTSADDADMEGDEEDDDAVAYELGDDEEIALPQYWGIVQKAFDDVDGNDLHKAYAATTATTTKVKSKPVAVVNNNRDGGETPPTSSDSNTAIKIQPTSRRNSVELLQSPQSRSINEPIASRDAHAAGAGSPGYANPYLNRRETIPTFLREAPAYVSRTFAPRPTEPAHNGSPSPSNNAQQKRPMSSQDPHSPADSGPAAKVQKMDIAQAIVSVGDTIASAIVESAKILAGTRARAASSGTADSVTIADLAAKMDTQLASQARMLALLEKSFTANEALAKQLRKQKSSNSSSSA